MTMRRFPTTANSIPSLSRRFPTLRVTPDMYARITNVAAYLGMSRPEFLRRAAEVSLKHWEQEMRG